MLPQKNKRPRSDDDVQFQRSRTSVNNQMQINDSPMEAEGVSPIPQDLPISAMESAIEEEEQKYRTNLLEKETDFKDFLYEEQRKDLEELMKCESSDQINNYVQQQLEKANEYVRNFKQDYNGIKERQISYKLKFLKIKKQDEQIALLAEEIKQKEERNAKREAAKAEKVATLEKIKKKKEEVKAEIEMYENRIQNRKQKKAKFDELQAKFQEKKQEKLQAEKRVEELEKKIEDIDEIRKARSEKHEAVMMDKRLRYEKLKMEIAHKKKKAEEVKDMQELIKNLEQQERIESDTRLRRHEEQKEELQKGKLKFKNLVEMFDTEELKLEELCKANGMEFVSFKDLEIQEIEKYVQNLQTQVKNKKIELDNSEKELERIKKDQEEEIQSKKEKLKEVTFLLETEKLKSEEQKKISVELNQKISDAQKIIEEQEIEKRENLIQKENALILKKELNNKIEEWKIKVAEKEKEILMIEDMYKDALDVNKDILEAVKNKEASEAEAVEYKKEHHAKMSEIENRITSKSKEYEKKISELESQIEQYAKALAQKKREGKKRDEEKMQKERNLRERLEKLEGEIVKLDKEQEVVSTSALEETPQQNLKSILKSPKAISSDPKSPKTVRFDIESEGPFSLSQK